MLKTHAEQYRSTFTKKDKSYRKKAKKKAIKTLAKKKAKKIQDAIDGETFSDAETIPYVDENLSDVETILHAEPYRSTFTKKTKKPRKKLLKH